MVVGSCWGSNCLRCSVVVVILVELLSFLQIGALYRKDY